MLKISKIVILSALALVMGWDLCAQIFGGTHATVSAAIWQFSSDVPFVPFLAGFVCGHLFWGDPSKAKGPAFFPKPKD